MLNLAAYLYLRLGGQLSIIFKNKIGCSAKLQVFLLVNFLYFVAQLGGGAQAPLWLRHWIPMQLHLFARFRTVSSESVT